MRLAHVLTVAAVALPLAACATPKVVQNLASTQAGVLNSYRTSLQSVADQQARLNEDNERRLRNLGELRTRNEAYIAQRLAGFEVAGDKPAGEIYGMLSARSAGDVVAASTAIAALTPPPPAPAVTYDPVQVNALVKSLHAAAKPPTRWETVIATFAYARDVYKTALQTSKVEGDAAEAAGEAASKDAAKALVENEGPQG